MPPQRIQKRKKGGIRLEFALLGPDKLKVSLSREDLRELGLDYRALDYSDENTRKALVSLLDRGRAEAGFHPRRAKLYIEVFPNEQGGCVIYYTRLAAGELFPGGGYAPGCVPVVFAFADPNTLIAACAAAHPRCGHRILRSALYRLGEEYRLVIWPLDYADNLSVFFLSEYGVKIGAGAVLAAYCEEHGQPLAEENALETLAALG